MVQGVKEYPRIKLQMLIFRPVHSKEVRVRDVGRMPIASASNDTVKSSEEVHYRHTTWPHCHKERVSNLAKVTLSLMLHLEFKPKIHLQTAHLSPQFLAPASFSPFSATCLLSLSPFYVFVFSYFTY